MTCPKIITDSYLFLSTRYDFVEIEDLSEKTILGRYCGSHSVPPSHTPKGSQIRIRFVSDEYFPSDPGFCIRYSLLPLVRKMIKFGKSGNLSSIHSMCGSLWTWEKWSLQWQWRAEAGSQNQTAISPFSQTCIAFISTWLTALLFIIVPSEPVPYLARPSVAGLLGARWRRWGVCAKVLTLWSIQAPDVKPEIMR